MDRAKASPMEFLGLLGPLFTEPSDLQVGDAHALHPSTSLILPCQPSTALPYHPPPQLSATCAALISEVVQAAPLRIPAIYERPVRSSATGHGGTASMRWSENPFVFLLQVSKRYEKCFRSSDPFLLVLPCPWSSGVSYDVSGMLRQLLLLGGDIEANPGPDLAKIAKQLESIAADIKDIKEKRLTDIEKKLDILGNLEDKVVACQAQIASMSTLIQQLEKQVDQLENHSRRSNLILYGLPESENETSDTLEHVVNKEVIRDILEHEPIKMERIHRIGRPAPNKVRPVIFKLKDANDKISILQQGSKLKDSDISIGADFSRRVRDVRRKLWASSKPNRDKKEKVSLVFDKLFINSYVYTWDTEKDERILLRKNDERKPNRPGTRQQSQLLHSAS